ncbi:ASCH domain-containing protein [Convivina praedatoris]|uniref:ASCH domain-containing protein n=1 Tax=Convivina praedatoris TaxID=2880963 RepID=A0ABN8HF20_9LACO|nr:ASCH domain-containing protein [Convivina sp. LMG 32447]CAH1856000.1 hypothetical protein R077815_01338 [Convivina sp. LMG 32447]CAH1856464.1 hypothetical protein LMG032447_01292 [Convivina sp. LMG 32447]CAH1857335.1 hypothetical protein R078138_01566 [Convivina sp. LMG 32447]
MTPDKFFQQAKDAGMVPSDSSLQSAFQFGVDADGLAQLVLLGVKTATTSGLDVYEADEELPQIGAYDIVLDGQNEPVCIIQNKQVEIENFLLVNQAHAFAEGEGDRSLVYWRRVHQEFFTKEYQSFGKKFDPKTARVVLEKFQLVYPLEGK